MYSNFNYIHIIYILLCPVLIVGFYYLFRNSKRSTKTVFLLVCVAISAGFEFYDTFAYVADFGWITVLYNLPLFACDLNIFILPTVIVLHLLGRDKPVLNKYVLYFTTTGPVFTMFLPLIDSGIYPWYSNEVLGTFIPHTLYIVVAVLYFKFFHVKCSPRQPWKVGLFIETILVVIHGINLFLYYTGLAKTANYMFTMTVPNVPAAQWGAALLGSGNPYIRGWLFMAVGYVLMTAMFYGIHKVFEAQKIKSLVLRFK